MMRLSARTEAEWKKFLTFADWSRASVYDLGQFTRVVASAMARKDEENVTSLFERDLDKMQVESELFQEIANLSDWVSEGILHYEEMRSGT